MVEKATERGLGSWWGRYIQSGVTEGDPLYLHAIRRTNLAIAAFVVVGPAYGLLFWMLGSEQLMWANLLASTAAALGIPLLRWTRRPEVAGNYLFVCFSAPVLYDAYFSGGIASPALMWVLIVPVGGAIMLGVRTALSWSVLVLAAMAGLAWLDWTGGTPVSVFEGVRMTIFRNFSLPTVLGLLMFFAYLSRLQEQHAVRRVERSMRRAKDEADRAESALAQLAKAAKHTETLASNLEALPVPVFEIDSNYEVIFINEAAARFLGKPRSACLGVGCHTLFRTHHCGKESCTFRRAAALRSATSTETRALIGSSNTPIAYTGIPQLDDGGAVVGALNVMIDLTNTYAVVDELRGVVGTVRGASGEALRETESIFGLTERIMELARVSSAVSGQVSSEIDDLSGASSELAGSSQSVTTKCVQASEVARRANEIAVEAKREIDRLEDNARAIGDVTELIADIADQTNLLSMNATIQASRAGEAGRGFIVVASEVKELANQTVASTDIIAERIESIQGQISEVASSIVVVTHIIDELAQLTAEIAETMSEQSERINQSAFTVDSSSRGITDLSRSVHAVSEASIDVTQRVGRFVGVTRDLSHVAGTLEDIVDRFRI